MDLVWTKVLACRKLTAVCTSQAETETHRDKVRNTETETAAEEQHPYGPHLTRILSHRPSKYLEG